jgi:glucose/arabinose dehydrogenase
MRSSIRAGALAVALAAVVGLGVRAVAQAPSSSIPRGADVAKQLPAPTPEKAGTRFAKVVGWPQGAAPKAASGFVVEKFAANLTDPRWPYVLPNGDVLVSESTGKADGPNRVVLLRDANKDGIAEEAHDFITGVRQPFGLLLAGGHLYVGSTNALLRYPFEPGQTRITAAPTRLLDLPVGGFNYHWTRAVVASADGSKLFISVGSGTNVDEEKDDVKEPRRATVLEVNPDGTGMRIFASGLRNPVGLAINPVSKALWTVVNERDMLGDDLVPDYLTSVKEGAFYGWPYSYYGQIEDPRKKGERPDLVAKAIPPDYALGAHVAPLGLHFYEGSAFPERYRNGAFVSLHGSWNRTRFAGYKVVFVPFKDGLPSGPMEDVLTGFIKDEQTNEVYGRPVGIAMLADGSLLVVDDAGNCVWRVSAAK